MWYGRDGRLARPALLDDLDQLVGDVDRPAIVPAIFEPALELVAGVVVEHVDVQLALRRQARQRQVAAAEKADRRVVRVVPEEQVELGVEGMAEEQLDAAPCRLRSCSASRRSPASSALVGMPTASCSRNSSASASSAAAPSRCRSAPRRREAHRDRGTRPPAGAASRRAADSRSRRRPPSARRRSRSVASRAG